MRPSNQPSSVPTQPTSQPTEHPSMQVCLYLLLHDIRLHDSYYSVDSSVTYCFDWRDIVLHFCFTQFLTHSPTLAHCNNSPQEFLPCSHRVNPVSSRRCSPVVIPLDLLGNLRCNLPCNHRVDRHNNQLRRCALCPLVHPSTHLFTSSI